MGESRDRAGRGTDGLSALTVRARETATDRINREPEHPLGWLPPQRVLIRWRAQVPSPSRGHGSSNRHSLVDSLPRSTDPRGHPAEPPCTKDGQSSSIGRPGIPPLHGVTYLLSKQDAEHDDRDDATPDDRARRYRMSERNGVIVERVSDDGQWFDRGLRVELSQEATGRPVRSLDLRRPRSAATRC